MSVMPDRISAMLKEALSIVHGFDFEELDQRENDGPDDDFLIHFSQEEAQDLDRLYDLVNELENFGDLMSTVKHQLYELEIDYAGENERFSLDPNRLDDFGAALTNILAVESEIDNSVAYEAQQTVESWKDDNE